MVPAPDKRPAPPDEITHSFSVIGTGYEMFTDHFNDTYLSYSLNNHNLKTNIASYIASIALEQPPDTFSVDGIQLIYVLKKVAQTIDERK